MIQAQPPFLPSFPMALDAVSDQGGANLRFKKSNRFGIARFQLSTCQESDYPQPKARHSFLLHRTLFQAASTTIFPSWRNPIA
jgi:hypothetical protein